MLENRSSFRIISVIIESGSNKYDIIFVVVEKRESILPFRFTAFDRNGDDAVCLNQYIAVGCKSASVTGD